MKILTLLTAILFCLVACKKTTTQADNISIIGKWKLSEYLADPGDGSGTWHVSDPLNPSYREFKGDGILVDSPSSATSWTHFQLTSDSTIIFSRDSEQLTISYHVSKTLLTLSGGCIEACGERYVSMQ
jgi:hypothetical protein